MIRFIVKHAGKNIETKLISHNGFISNCNLWYPIKRRVIQNIPIGTSPKVPKYVMKSTVEIIRKYAAIHKNGKWSTTFKTNCMNFLVLVILSICTLMILISIIALTMLKEPYFHTWEGGQNLKKNFTHVDRISTNSKRFLSRHVHCKPLSVVDYCVIISFSL